MHSTTQWWKRIKLHLYEGTKVSTLRGPAQLADLQGALCVPPPLISHCPVTTDLIMRVNVRTTSTKTTTTMSQQQWCIYQYCFITNIYKFFTFFFFHMTPGFNQRKPGL